MRKYCLCTKKPGKGCFAKNHPQWSEKLTTAAAGAPPGHTGLLRVILLHKGSPFLWLTVPHRMLGCHSKPLSFVFWAVHPWPEIAMLVHILVPHTPWVPTAPASALSGDDCSRAVQQSKENGE